MNKSKNQKLIESFATYCKTHPEERFWQALRNWSEVDYIKIENNITGLGSHEIYDTFYLEGKNKEDLSTLDTNEV